MQDPRIATLAKNLIRYSVRLQPGEKVLIDTVGYELPLTKALIRAAYQVGGQPYLNISHDDLLAALLEGASRARYGKPPSGKPNGWQPWTLISVFEYRIIASL